jgi:hypothetical protein
MIHKYFHIKGDYILNDHVYMNKYHGSISLKSTNIKKLPIKLGKVTGNLYFCNNTLESLER